MNPTCSLKLSLIRADLGTQSRAATNEETVADYAERMQAGDKFPPVVVFQLGDEYVLADGFHRFLAAQRAEFKDILADVRKGTFEDALWYSLGANTTNGVQRTRQDKWKCVELALAKFSDLSDRQIEKHCAVSDTFVAKVRAQKAPTANVGSQKRIGADGKARKMPKKKAVTKPSPKTEIHLEQFASERFVKKILFALEANFAHAIANFSHEDLLKVKKLLEDLARELGEHIVEMEGKKMKEAA